MTRLNRAAADALAGLAHGSVHACTDITGFGLIGHATEMARASGCLLTFETARVPLLDGALDLVDRNTPGGGRTNKDHFGAGVRLEPTLDPRVIQLLYDPQTSGGLLVAVAPESAAAAVDALRQAGAGAHEVGFAGPPEPPSAVALTLR
jgi:selenide,water dikinase